MAPRMIITEESTLLFTSKKLQAAHLYWSGCAGGAVTISRGVD